MQLYERMKASGLTDGSVILANQVGRLTRKKLIDLAAEFAKEESALTLADKAILRFSSASSLAGGKDECIELACRRERLLRLSRFSTLYGDVTYLQNYFADYEHLSDSPLDELRSMFFEDLVLSWEIRDVVQEGYLVFESPMNLCADCLGRALGYGEGGNGSLESAIRELRSN